MAAQPSVTPNRRGTRSREAVLDAAERLMAEQGYEAATIAALVEQAGVPASSIYHYFGSKEGVLLAVMERGAGRFFGSLPELESEGTPAALLAATVEVTSSALERHPDFLRLLVVLAAQPVETDASEVRRVVNRVRNEALVQLRARMEVAFGVAAESRDADQLARFTLAAFDGAFIAWQSDPQVRLADLLRHLPAALIAIRADLAR